jgi:hypothetical protein
MVNEAAFRSLAQSSHRSNASESSLLGTFMSRYDYVELIQCSSFQDGATVHITDGACPTRTLELCGKETAAGLLLALAEDASITPDHSLAVTYRERGEPKAEGLDCLMPWEMESGTLMDGTNIRYLLTGLKAWNENGIEKTASGAFVWPYNEKTLHARIGARRIVHL